MNSISTPSHPQQEVIRVALDDPRAEPLISGLTREYTQRYGDFFGGAEQEMQRYPAVEFDSPTGALLLIREHGETIAGGAFRRHRATVAEFKRIWTHEDHRRRGLARRVLDALEAEAGSLGYTGVYLTTGPRQPEAVRLYASAGYTPLFDVEADPESVGQLAFTKELHGAFE